MTARLDYFRIAPDVLKPMLALEEAASALSISPALRLLVKMRVSQINGCAYCLHMHAPAALDAGVSQEKLDVLAAWRESPAFDTRERAALRWAEALTRIEASGVPDGDYEDLAAAFDPRERVELTLIVNTINAWNRFAVAFRSVHPRRASADAAA